MKKIFTPDDLKNFVYLSRPVMSADGERIACVCKKGDEESGNHIPAVSVFRKQADGSYSECPDLEIQRAEQPYFMADSRFMTYVTDVTDEKQVWLKNLETGETRQITHLRHGVKNYRLSPDETKVAFEAVLWPEETEKGIAFTEMTPEEKAAWLDELDYTPYVTETLVYKMDEWYGMRKGEFSHIGTADLDGSDAVIFDLSGMEAETPAWSYDSGKIAFYGYPYKDAHAREKELFVISTDGSDLKQLTKKLGIYDNFPPVWSKDDSEVITFAFPAYADMSSVITPYAVRLTNLQARPLLGEWDEKVCFGAAVMIAGRTENGTAYSNSYVSADGTKLYFLSGLKARTGIYRVDITGEEPAPAELVQKGCTDIQNFYLGAQDEIVYLQGDFTHPAELFYKGQQLTDRNAWLQEYAFGETEECFVQSKDGKAMIQYFLMHPVNQEAGKLYPAVLDIKGGPETMYGANYWHEFHALASAGMAVIYPNPRSSSGFGRAYMADMICWKQEVVDDMESVVQDAVRHGFIDEKKVGVTGGSYGGYMTNKLMGRSELFAAAVTQRSLVNPATSYGTGDMGFISSSPVPEDFHMLDYLEDRAKGNIITYIDHFKIPLLILHAYRDYRCSFEQAEQLFEAMIDRNPEVPVRMIMFPKENHELTRTGKLYNQIRHLQEMRDWFIKYLITEKKEAADE